MSRRRYLSTNISTDTRVRQLAERSEFAVLLYTWIIPHASDDGSITADPDELMMLVVPGFRWRTTQDVADALGLIVEVGLLESRSDVLRFPKAFYKYQAYIPVDRRETAPPPPTPEPTTPNGADQRESAQKSTSVNSPSPLSSGAPPVGGAPVTGASAREGDGPDAPAARAAPKDEMEPETTPPKWQEVATGVHRGRPNGKGEITLLKVRCPRCEASFAPDEAESHECATEPKGIKIRPHAAPGNLGQHLPRSSSEPSRAQIDAELAAMESTRAEREAAARSVDLVAEHKRRLAQLQHARAGPSPPSPDEPAPSDRQVPAGGKAPRERPS